MTYSLWSALTIDFDFLTLVQLRWFYQTIYIYVFAGPWTPESFHLRLLISFGLLSRVLSYQYQFGAAINAVDLLCLLFSPSFLDLIAWGDFTNCWTGADHTPTFSVRTHEAHGRIIQRLRAQARMPFLATERGKEKQKFTDTPGSSRLNSDSPIKKTFEV